MDIVRIFWRDRSRSPKKPLDTLESEIKCFLDCIAREKDLWCRRKTQSSIRDAKSMRHGSLGSASVGKSRDPIVKFHRSNANLFILVYSFSVFSFNSFRAVLFQLDHLEPTLTPGISLWSVWYSIFFLSLFLISFF